MTTRPTRYIKRTTPLPIAEVRRDILRHDIGISVDYYSANETENGKHCAWVCTDIDCDKCGDGFTSFPAFLKHLKVFHKISFSLVRLEILMRQKYHIIGA